MDELLKALTILRKYGNPKRPFHCEHDYLYVDIQAEKVSEEDMKELEEYGFFPDEEYNEGGFGSFRYGSS